MTITDKMKSFWAYIKRCRDLKFVNVYFSFSFFQFIAVYIQSIDIYVKLNWNTYDCFLGKIELRAVNSIQRLQVLKLSQVVVHKCLHFYVMNLLSK